MKLITLSLAQNLESLGFFRGREDSSLSCFSYREYPSAIPADLDSEYDTVVESFGGKFEWPYISL
jgi:hypothetical protein